MEARIKKNVTERDNYTDLNVLIKQKYKIQAVKFPKRFVNFIARRLLKNSVNLRNRLLCLILRILNEYSHYW